jgi:hypothetical protein
MKNIKLFKDQDDYEKVLTDDNIINVIGTKGSGKTTSSLKYIDDSDYIVVNCDRLLDLPDSNEKEDIELANIKRMLKEKYGVILTGKEFINCYNDIVKYVLDKNKKGLIEGNLIQDINPSLLKGKVIIKRTGVVKSFGRAIKRDYSNEYFMNLEKERHKYFYKATRLYKITKRRSKVFKQAKDIDIIMENLKRR